MQYRANNFIRVNACIKQQLCLSMRVTAHHIAWQRWWSWCYHRLVVCWVIYVLFSFVVFYLLIRTLTIAESLASRFCCCCFFLSFLVMATEKNQPIDLLSSIIKTRFYLYRLRSHRHWHFDSSLLYTSYLVTLFETPITITLIFFERKRKKKQETK